MAKAVYTDLDMQGVARLINLPDGTLPQHAATVAQLNSAVEGLAWKDSAIVATQSNLNLAAPGATIDGVTMTSGDRILVRAQTLPEANGIYVWNGAAAAATRSLDASTSAELEQAIISVEEGTSAGVTYRQTSVNFVLDTGAVGFSTFGQAAAAASETVAGVAELATQAETDAGADDARIVTPLKLKTSPWAKLKFSTDIGDGSAVSYTVTHNLNTRDVQVSVYRNSGAFDEILVDIQHTTVNSVTIVFATGLAPASNAFRVVVIG